MPAMLPIVRAFLGCAALLPLLSATAAPEYRMTKLGPSQPVSWTYGINNRGVLAGYVGAAKGRPAHAVRFVQTRARNIDRVGNRLPHPYALNDAGTVVGDLRGEAVVIAGRQPVRLFDRLAPQGTWKSLLEAFDINDRGQIVGLGELAGGGFRGFLYQNGVATVLPGLSPESPTTARAVNEAGVAVGSSGVPASRETTHAVVFLPGETRDLGVRSRESWAIDLNEQGVIVGAYRFGDGVTRVFLYRDGVITKPGAFPGYRRMLPTAINEAGDVVGTADQGGKRLDHGFLYRNGNLYNLNDLVANRGRYRISAANGINDRGVIAATAYEPATGKRIAVRLDPRPNR